MTAVTAKAIADAILTGQFSPGQRLLELDIANDLKISRAPLREALRQLASEGLIEIRPNRGTYVVDPSPEEIAQMSVTRALIEGASARLVAYRREPEAIGRLGAIIDAMLEADARGDRAAIFRHHWDFHRAVCAESGNPYLLKAWSSASSIIRIYYRMQLASDIIRSNNAFIKSLREASPEDAEGLFRSQIIRTAFRVVNLPVPPEVASYLTHEIEAP